MNNLIYLNQKGRDYHKILGHVNDPLYITFSDDLIKLGAAKDGEPELLTKAALYELKKRARLPLTYAEIDPASAALLAQTIVSREDIVQAYNKTSIK